MKEQNGMWIILDEKPSDIALNGVPREGEQVVVDYFTLPTSPSQAHRVASPIENKDVFKKRTTGATLIYAAL